MLDELVRRWCAEVDWVAIDRAVVPASAVKSGSLAAAADAMQRAIRDELGLASAAGIADTEVAANVAAALVAPSGLLQVLPGYDARFLAPLDLRWLPALSAAARERLDDSEGSTTIGASGRAAAARGRSGDRRGLGDGVAIGPRRGTARARQHDAAAQPDARAAARRTR